MKDIVLIPTYRRPEYLYLCLEHLAKTYPDAQDREFWICEDSRPHDEYTFKIVREWEHDVYNAWIKRLPLCWIKQREHEYNGNSFNVMRSYRAAYEQPDVRFVYLVEDDVFVTPDFFRWHEDMSRVEPNAMCSIAYRCSRNHEAKKDISDPAAYFSTARDYASIGVRWPKEKLAWVVEHDKDSYYRSQDQYMVTRFPNNRFSRDFSEQDGLIMRVMWEIQGYTVWPYVPRCYHMGWYGYHRPNGKRPNGFLDAKIDEIRRIVSDEKALKEAAPDFGDIEPFPKLGIPRNVSVADYQKWQNFD